jgi:Toxin SymE, type I toxin-antitoxin system
MERRSSEIARLSTDPDAPFIRLRGKWLQQAGFEVADEIEVRALHRQLIINPVSRLIRRRTIHSEQHVEQRRDLVSHPAD